MSLANLTAQDLKVLQRLVEKRDALNLQLLTINQQLDAFANGATPRPARKQPRKAARSKATSRAGYGAVKEQIIAVLKEAGASGVRVKEVADRLGLPPANVRVWFYTTGKKIKEIRRGKQRGVFSWQE